MAKKDIFVNTLEKEYSQEKFVEFIREMVTGVKMFNFGDGKTPYNTFSSFVSKYFNIGEFEDNEKNKIGVFAIELKSGESVERARSTQRNFVKTLLENPQNGYDAALVAFYSIDDTKTWRLSFIKLDYEFAEGKISKKFTPAKRYSYLVGEGEPCHTAQSRLLPIFMDDNKIPSIDEIEEAFSVEAVTKEFFEAYKNKYIEMKKFLDKNEDFVAESERRGFTSEQFTKKLLSQIVFLYFVQKKGWLGVNAIPKNLSRSEYNKAYYLKGYGSKPKTILEKVYLYDDDCYKRNDKELLGLSLDDETFLAKIVKGEKWGTGHKSFLKFIFDKCEKRGLNYFDDYLEPLFYDGLNKNRGDIAFFQPLHCRIPFLNGGLFEQLDDYDWENNKFNIPNEMFSNEDKKGKENADGILDVFNRYNFTMAEDEPMEREVAIDPEMLGKVFENLLEEEKRKEKGAFYTPREIVHYMCQESLINYLVTKTNIKEDDIRKFILFGEYFKDKDVEKTKRMINEKTGKSYYVLDKQKDFEIPSSIFSYKEGTNRLNEIDYLLANIKVVDPAVGSGAFLLGMLNEIVKARDTISKYLAIEMDSYQTKKMYASGYKGSRNSYDLKRETMKNSIFASDIEPSATDISKLRLWLSLVIDDEINEDDNEEFGEHSKPKALPNLDCNIICGDSLTESFEGVKIANQSILLKNMEFEHQENMFQADFDKKIQTLIELQDKLFDIKEHNEKEEIKHNIETIYNQIVEQQLEINPQALEKYHKRKISDSKPFILWEVYFPKVFNENGGFDVCIGNPPYVQLQKRISEDSNVKLGDLYIKEGYETFTKTGDIYCLFYEKGCKLLREKGVLSYITSNKWLRAGYGEKLRNYFVENTQPIQIVDFGKVKVFETATVDVNILLLQKMSYKFETKACIIKESCKDKLHIYIMQNNVESNFKKDEIWSILTPIEKQIKEKIEKMGHH